jgi:hypothetical protein
MEMDAVDGCRVQVRARFRDVPVERLGTYGRYCAWPWLAGGDADWDQGTMDGVWVQVPFATGRGDGTELHVSWGEPIGTRTKYLLAVSYAGAVPQYLGLMETADDMLCGDTGSLLSCPSCLLCCGWWSMRWNVVSGSDGMRSLHGAAAPSLISRACAF